MTRGRLPVRAQDEADPIGRKRGIVQHFRHEPGAVFSFAIFSLGCTAHVRMKCMRRLGCTVQEIERELAEILAAIRRTVSCREVTRELWLCSPRYAWRFFRVDDHGLVEIDKDGLAAFPVG